MKIKKPYVILNGLKWSVKNLKIGEQAHFTYQQAINILNGSGGRLPTKNEFEELANLFNLWDDTRFGTWFAEKSEDLKSDKSLFLSADGFEDYPSKDIRYFDKYGYYWGFSNEDKDYSASLAIGENQLFTHEYNIKYGHSVICILE